MPKQIIIAEQHRIGAVFSGDQIQEIIVSTGQHQVCDIYLGVVENILQGIDAAFVNIGDPARNGFIHVTDLGPLRLKKNASAITELLTPQQKVLVQVMKEPTGNKGPRLTGNVSLPGRYLVLMPYGRGVNLSRRIKSENERSRLRALAILIKPAGMGLLVRTEADGKGEDAIMEDLEYLQRQWEIIQQQASSTRAPALLNRDDDFIQRVLRDMYTAEVNRIVVDSNEGVRRVKQQLINWGGGKAPEGILIDHHQEYQAVLEYFRVNAAIKEALKPRVDLPSGGYIIIEPTEALAVIDVNSGSFTRSATARETVLWTNSEAATEIARQLRLRNIGGVIIVDFIDMDSRRDQLKLLEHFNKVLKADKARPQIAQLSELGLVELTRKRQGKNIYELFSQPCAHCGGFGHLVRLPGQSDELMLSTYSPPSAIWKLPEKPTTEPEMGAESAWDSLPEEDSLEMEFLNHPNYQEQGVAVAANRRRRRRVKEGGREDLLFPIVTPTEQPILETESSAPILQLDRKERSLSRGITRRDETTLERVSLEMTELEQDVYALMGVSPLIRLEKKFKDTKSVIVTVSLPGESKAIDNPLPVKEMEETQSEQTELDLQSETVPQSDYREEQISFPQVRIKSESKPRIESRMESTVLSVPLSFPEIEPMQIPVPGLEFVSKSESEAEAAESAIIRRRRRRSSASSSNGEG